MTNNERIKKILNTIDLLIITVTEKVVNDGKQYNHDLYKKIYNLRSTISNYMFSNNQLIDIFIEYIPPEKLGDFDSKARCYFLNENYPITNAPRDINEFLSIQETIKTYCKYKNIRIFYSWQSDTPNSTNRSFIKDSIQKAINLINDEKGIQMYLDSDTRGECGSPDIVATILRKIDDSQAFICDVTSIGKVAKKEIPNPNVLFELGYALKCLGESRIIMIYNSSFGKIEDLPFDLNQKRIMIYNCPLKLKDKSDIKKDLSKSLKTAIELILESY